MTDLEITKLCAEAMGLKFRAVDGIYVQYLPDPENEPTGWVEYRPTHNDAQAMALVKRFRMTILHIWVRGPYYLATVEERSQKVIADARNEDLNRAICECVAHMQKAKSQS